MNTMDLETANSMRYGILIGRTIMLALYVVVCALVFCMSAPEAFPSHESEYTDEFRAATILLPISVISWIVLYLKTNDIKTTHKKLLIIMCVSCGIDLTGGVTALITLSSRGGGIGLMFFVGIILPDGIRVLLTMLTDRCNAVIKSYWFCECGFANVYGANFCGRCGKQRPAAVPVQNVQYPQQPPYQGQQ